MPEPPPRPTPRFEAKPVQPVWTQPEAAPREPSRFETAAKEMFCGKSWNWIIVGEDHVPDGVSMEYAVASNWLLRIAVLILVMGIGFFLSYAIKNGWIDPTGQVLLARAAGLALLVAGTRMLGGRYHLFGQGLIGAGIATLYLSCFAAHTRYHLIGDLATFGLMVLVTCIAGWIAVRFNSLLVAVLGIVGGYATPIMLHTGEENFVKLFAYVLVLGGGVLAISYRKNWHLLNYLSFLGTYTLLFGSLAKFWEGGQVLAGDAVPDRVLRAVLDDDLPLQPGEPEEIDAAGSLGTGGQRGSVFRHQQLPDPRRGPRFRAWVAVVSLGLAAFYAAHVYYFLVRRLLDRELLLSFTALAAFFLAVTIPLCLPNKWLTASWAIQALAMLWIAGKLESHFLRQVAYLLYVVVLFRFGFVDLRTQYAGAAAGNLPVADYLLNMVQRVLTLGIPIGSLAGAAWLLRRAPPKPAMPVGRANDVSPWLGRNWIVGAAVVAVAGLLFVALNLELDRSLQFFFPPLRLPALSLLWIAMCVVLLRTYRAEPNDVLLVVIGLFVAGLVVKLFYFDLMAWT